MLRLIRNAVSLTRMLRIELEEKRSVSVVEEIQVC
jgi:hypothetical protein